MYLFSRNNIKLREHFLIFVSLGFFLGLSFFILIHQSASLFHPGMIASIFPQCAILTPLFFPLLARFLRLHSKQYTYQTQSVWLLLSPGLFFTGITTNPLLSHSS
jgi:hypothetical protein